MSIKSEADWRGLREVGGIVRLTLEALEKHVQEGVTIHEPPAIPNAVDPSQRDVLTEGLVVAIEPIISAGSGETFEERDGWTMVVITKREPFLLTAA